VACSLAFSPDFCFSPERSNEGTATTSAKMSLVFQEFKEESWLADSTDPPKNIRSSQFKSSSDSLVGMDNLKDTLETNDHNPIWEWTIKHL